MVPSGHSVALSIACLTLALLSGTSAIGHAGEPLTDTAVLDRFEGDIAILVFDGSRKTVSIDRSALPLAGRHADAVFEVSWRDGAVEGIEYDRATTRERVARSQSRFDRLSRPANGSTVCCPRSITAPSNDVGSR